MVESPLLDIHNIKRYKLFENREIKLFEPLENQGHCNINYLLATEDKKYLIRKFKLKNDRKSEFGVQKIAYTKKIASRPILLDETEGLMICEFIEGIHKAKPNRRELQKLALLIKRLHRVKIRQKSTNLRKNFKFRDKKALQAFIKLKALNRELVLCHNDLHPRNILFSKDIKLIDWEYARVNDRYFDLASIIIEFKLSQIDETIFLQSYFRRDSKVNHQKLIAYKIIYRELWRLWFEKLNRGELEIEV